MVTAGAQASHWEVTYDGGKGALPYSNLGTGTPYEVNIYEPTYSGYYGHNSGAWVRNAGEITSTFTWKKDYNETTLAPCPTAVYVLETCFAYARAWWYQGLYVAQDDNGLGTGTAFEVDPVDEDGFQITEATSNGWRIRAVSPYAGTFQVKASPMSRGHYESYVWYDARVVDYAIGIKLSNEINYRKGEDGQPVANERAFLTPRRADWGVLESDVTQSGYVIAPTFQSVKIGNWNNPFNVWQAGNQTYQDTYLNEVDEIHPIWVQTASWVNDLGTNPVTALITHTVTDNGNSGPAMGTAIMNFVIHNRWEGWARKDSERSADLYLPHSFSSVQSPGYAGPPSGSVHCTWTYNSICFDEVQDVVQGMTAIAGNIVQHPIYAGFIAAIGVASNEYLPEDAANTCSFVGAWGANKSTIDGQVPTNWPATSEQYKYVCYPILFDIYSNYPYYADQYGHTGYEGIQRSWVKKRYNFWLVGNFVNVDNSNNGGGN